MQTQKDEDLEMTGMGETRTPIWRNEIIKLKTRALRKGVWYRAISKLERACIDVVISVVERVRSRLLTKVLFSVFSKLEEALESRVQFLTREIGSKLVHELSQIAQKWGYKGAERWVNDVNFERYLAVTRMNSPQ